MKRTPLKRTTPLSRSRMQKRPRRARPGKDDAAYLRWVRMQPCSFCDRGPPNEAHHRPGAGLALKSHDHEAIPMCRSCHHDVTFFTGYFRGTTREQRQTWHSAQVAIMRARYAQRGAA